MDQSGSHSERFDFLVSDTINVCLPILTVEMNYFRCEIEFLDGVKAVQGYGPRIWMAPWDVPRAYPTDGAELVLWQDIQTEGQIMQMQTYNTNMSA